MRQEELRIIFQVYGDRSELEGLDAALFDAAQAAVGLSYAPYSRFRVGAAARLRSGTIVPGSNQENSSFPAGLCAERVLLSTVSSLHPGDAIESIAVTYEGEGLDNAHPLSPCGVCRQSLAECEERFGTPIRILMGGMRGEVRIAASVGDLLPFRFSGTELPK